MKVGARSQVTLAEIEAARLKLANALLSVAAEDSRDVEALKMGALEAMTLEYRQRQRIAG